MTTVNPHVTRLAGVLPLTAEELPFDPSIEIRSFLIERPAGNILIYNTAGLAGDLDRIRARGGAERQYLNHRHEALFGSTEPARELGAKLIVHAADAPAVRRRGWDAHLTFDRRHALDGDFEVIPTPGHTPGATAYLWSSGEERLLFTGDSVYLKDGRWVAAVLDSSDRSAYARSLEELSEVEFDVLVPWAAQAGGPWFDRVGPQAGRERLAELARRVRDGARS